MKPKLLLHFFLMIAGISIILFGFYKAYQLNYENTSWIKTTGVIVEMEKYRIPKDLSGDDYIPIIEYTNDYGNKLISSNFPSVKRTTSDPSNEYVGKDVSLIYNPKNNAEVVYYHSNWEYVGVIIMMLFGLTILVVGIILSLRLKNINKTT